MLHLYLDIDGVLVTTRNTKAAEQVDSFVDFITTNFDCYWLTTHCRGDAAPAIQYLSQYLQEETINKLRQVKASNWSALKTEGIDFSKPFIWLDDQPMQAELKVLEAHHCEDAFVLVDLNNLNELMEIAAYLRMNNE